MSWLRLTPTQDGYDILHVGHIAGDTFGPVELTVQDAAGAPVDLTGADVRGALRRLPADPAPLAVLQVVPLNAHTVSLQLSAEATRDLPPGRSDVDPQGLYSGALRLTDSLGREQTIVRIRWQSLAP